MSDVATAALAAPTLRADVHELVRRPGSCSRRYAPENTKGSNDHAEVAYRRGANGTDFVVTLGKPLQLYVDGDHAYVVTRDSVTFKDKGKPMKQAGAIHAFALLKTGSGWRIKSEAWADTLAATALQAKDAGRD